MAFGIVTTTNARRDIQNAIDWENSRSNNLGTRFFDELQLKLKVLAVTPLIGSVRYESVRCISTNVFQYLIHYTVNEEAKQIIVLRVLHMSRKPTW